MDLVKIEEQLEDLNHRLRILILQNVHEEDGYDEQFLSEMNQITKQILGLRQLLSRGTLEVNNSTFQSHQTSILKH